MRISSNLNIIVKSLELAAKSIHRDYNELQHLQNNINSRVKFANSSYIKLKKLISNDLSRIRPEYNLIFSDNEKIVNDINSKYFFNICAIDSLINYSRACIDFAIGIALQYKEPDKISQPIAAAIIRPITNEIIYCEKDMGVFYNNRRINDNYKIGDSVIITPDITISDKNIAINIRSYGSILSEIMFVAINRIDALSITPKIYNIAKDFTLINNEAKNSIKENGDNYAICSKSIAKLIL